jgi:hypothetical protein
VLEKHYARIVNHFRLVSNAAFPRRSSSSLLGVQEKMPRDDDENGILPRIL